MKLNMKQIKLKNRKKKKIKRKDLIYETKRYKYGFQQYKPIKSFGQNIYTRKINLVEAEEDQSNLLNNLVEFNNKSRARAREGKDKKEY